MFPATSGLQDYARAITGACDKLQHDLDSIPARATLRSLIKKGRELSCLLADQSPAAVEARRAILNVMSECAAQARAARSVEVA